MVCRQVRCESGDGSDLNSDACPCWGVNLTPTLQSFNCTGFSVGQVSSSTFSVMIRYRLGSLSQVAASRSASPAVSSHELVYGVLS